MLKWLLAVVVLYGGFVALLYVAQRSIQYFPERRRTAPWAAGLPEAEEAVLDTGDGKRVIVWHVPPREGRDGRGASGTVVDGGVCYLARRTIRLCRPPNRHYYVSKGVRR
jgi:hypothetical protein